MPIFVNYKKKIFVLTSYKVGQTTLKRLGEEQDLKYLNHKIDFRIYKHFLKHINFKKYQLIRHPYNRFVSLFKDKFRVQPNKFQDEYCNWQPIHYLIMPYLGLDKNATNNHISETFLNLNINDFVLLLPKIYLLEGHLTPQKHTSSLKIINSFYLPIRIDKFLKIEENQEGISKITGVDFNIKRNVTNSSDLLTGLNSKSYVILNSIYKRDFTLGNYDTSILS